jgi:hypothetical protein
MERRVVLAAAASPRALLLGMRVKGWFAKWCVVACGWSVAMVRLGMVLLGWRGLLVGSMLEVGLVEVLGRGWL